MMKRAQAMDSDTVIFWLVCLSCLSGAVVTVIRARAAARGWLLLYLVILAVALLGHFSRHSLLVYLALGLWLVFVLGPGLVFRLYFQRFLQQRYATAARLARLLAWLHPGDGWREQPHIIHALHLAQNGDFSGSTAILQRFQDQPSLIGLIAVANLYRMTSQWDQLLAWLSQRLPEVQRHPQLLPVLMRAHAETGDLRAMVALYHANQARIARLAPAASRDFCRLTLFAFCGQRHQVERLFAGSLAQVPASTREFWLATADLAAGEPHSARRRLEALRPAADPPLARAIGWRLARLAAPQPLLDSHTQGVLNEAVRDFTHDESFGAQPSVFSTQARATQLVLGLNLLAFVAESVSGGSTNSDSLLRLGALFAPDVRAGQWWRLGASLFLHWGPLHLAMNMFALCILGPFVEFALGFRRFLLVYLLAGVGSMAVVLGLSPHGDQLTVGASGCIMGLVGATGALMLRGWLRARALAARRRFVAMLLIIGLQTIFDSLIPQVSMTAHLSGALIGFAISLLLRDSLVPSPPLPPVRDLQSTSPS